MADYSSSDEKEYDDGTKMMKGSKPQQQKYGRYTLPLQLMVLLAQEEIERYLGFDGMKNQIESFVSPYRIKNQIESFLSPYRINHEGK